MIIAIKHAMEILELLADEPDGLSVTELSAHVGANKGSIVRVLVSLQATGHLVQDANTERYHLSLVTVSIANRYMDRLGFPLLIQPILNELAEATGELAQLSARNNDRLYVVAKAEGENRIRVDSLLGREIALHASATGKAWLSGMPRGEAIRILGQARISKLTPRTLTNLTEIQREIDEARDRGYALQREELMEHMCAIALPVRRQCEKIPVGALVVAAPTFRFPDSRIPEICSLLQRAVERLGAVWPPAGVQAARELAVIPTTSEPSAV